MADQVFMIHYALDIFRNFIQRSPQTDFIFGGHVLAYGDGVLKKHGIVN